jgi:hypothetical protein
MAYTYAEFCQWLVSGDSNSLRQGLYVSVDVRRNFLLKDQNKIIRHGGVISPEWENMGSDVYFVKFVGNE